MIPALLLGQIAPAAALVVVARDLRARRRHLRGAVMRATARDLVRASLALLAVIVGGAAFATWATR